MPSTARCRWPVSLAGTLARRWPARRHAVDGHRLAAEYPAPGQPATRSLGPDLNALVVDADGNLYLALRDTSTIKKLTPDGELTTVAAGGRGLLRRRRPGGTKARLDFPHGLTVDAAGRLLIADTANKRIRRWTRTGHHHDRRHRQEGRRRRQRARDPGGVRQPGGRRDRAARRDLRRGGGGNRVRRIDPAGRITTVAGTGPRGSRATAARRPRRSSAFPWRSPPTARTCTSRDTDGSAGSPRNGTITTFAGRRRTPTRTRTRRRRPGHGGQLNTPDGMTVAEDGTVYIADRGASRVRRVTPDGLITTVAGTGTPGLSGDRGPSAQAQLAGPAAILAGENGDVYIADTENHRVRLLRDGKITTIAGSGPDYPGDGGPAAEANCSTPRGPPRPGRRGVHRRRRQQPHPPGRPRRHDHHGRRHRRKGYAGDGGPADEAELSRRPAWTSAPDGTLYIADDNPTGSAGSTPAGPYVRGGHRRPGLSGGGRPGLRHRPGHPGRDQRHAGRHAASSPTSTNQVYAIGQDGVVHVLAGLEIEPYAVRRLNRNPAPRSTPRGCRRTRPVRSTGCCRPACRAAGRAATR